ncbi:MAG TPA: OsmC family protein [Gemmatimonadaceae bacterium]|nr:OsmC family protein [Gemmatimonadaceae bacterium]
MPDNNEEGARWVEARVGPKAFRTDISARHHRLTVDEPESVGGDDAGPTPYEFLLIAIASCTVMTMRSYANRKSWPLESAAVFMRHTGSHKIDCDNCDSTDVGIERMERRIELEGPLTDEQRARLIELADRCPVKQTLKRGIDVVSSPT